MSRKQWIVWILIGLALSGCVSPPPLPPPPPAAPEVATPAVSQIVLVGGESTSESEVIQPGDAAFDPLQAAWATLLNGVEDRARTFFSAERYQQEIAPLPRIEARFDAPVPILAADPSTAASHLVFVFIDNGNTPLLLAEIDGSWSAFLIAPAATDAFVSQVAEQTDLHLRP